MPDRLDRIITFMIYIIRVPEVTMGRGTIRNDNG